MGENMECRYCKAKIGFMDFLKHFDKTCDGCEKSIKLMQESKNDEEVEAEFKEVEENK